MHSLHVRACEHRTVIENRTYLYCKVWQGIVSPGLIAGLSFATPVVSDRNASLLPATASVSRQALLRAGVCLTGRGLGCNWSARLLQGQGGFAVPLPFIRSCDFVCALCARMCVFFSSCDFSFLFGLSFLFFLITQFSSFFFFLFLVLAFCLLPSFPHLSEVRSTCTESHPPTRVSVLSFFLNFFPFNFSSFLHSSPCPPPTNVGSPSLTN